MSVHLARGTRDFLPDAAARRHQVLDQVRVVFARHGFEPLQTPAIERIETLMGKYGDEGSKLIYKILKRGEGAARGECDLALRYDLTVPLARVIAMNPQLRMPFKRWQAAPVWRAERPARGRYREFWQCDGDIVGSTEPLADAQCVAVACDALTELGFTDFTVRLNDRRVLRALARTAGAEGERETSLLVAVDKLDKIGRDAVDAELASRGFEDAQRAAVWGVLELSGSNAELLEQLGARLDGAEVEQAVSTLTQVLELAEALGVDPARLAIDPTLARGLDYYTGPVFEVTVTEPAVGSIAGGGRYDELVGVFGKQSVPAVGFALGIERILLVMEELDMFGPRTDGVQALVTVYDASQRAAAVQAATHLRREGVRTDLYVGAGSLKSQLKYANAKAVRWVLIVGPSESAAGQVTLKDMEGGGQQTLPLEEAAARIAG
ncbi:MAG: histidine--tRNA ligase [Myxococcales bacterium]|nr:histidine--tRNA ligase [Myxococcales bacterium]